MRDLLEWAVAGYMSNPDASDGDIAGLLAGGFPPGLASRAVAFVPLAFGRRMLRGVVSLPATFVGPAGEAPLAGEPLFVLAEKLVAAASREEIERIGPRSAEVRAVNAALNAGS
jgi:hypothetical protein